MKVLRRPVATTVLLVACAGVPAGAQFTEPAQAAGPTCDPAGIDPASYALTTRAQAAAVTEGRLDWWDGFDPGSPAAALAGLHASSTWASERALEIDPNNLLAHGVIARQYVVLGIDGARARQAWRTVLDHGGAVVWTATLYDVDARSYFVLAFGRDALRVYRFGELAGPVETHLGVPRIPGADRERLWRAWGGCVDPAARPEAVIPWDAVREIKAGNWVLYFKLDRRVRITSDRGKRADVREIKVNLHGATGSLEVSTRRDPAEPGRLEVRTVGLGPLAYQERVRRTLVAAIDPAGRIALPKASRGAGW